MRRITWINLKPPGYDTADIVECLLRPAIFENPEIGNAIQSASDYTRVRKGCMTDIYTSLRDLKGTRSRLFTRMKTPTDSRGISERMLGLLLAVTSSEDVPYTMDSYPIRHAFRVQWMRILSPLVPGEYLESLQAADPDWYRETACISLSEKDSEQFRDYIQNLVEGDEPQDAEDLHARLHYHKRSLSLSLLLRAIQPCDYAHTYYKSDAALTGLTEENNLLFERLATLSVIASAWYIWESAEGSATYQEQLFRLAGMLFPAERLRELLDKDQSAPQDTDSGKAAETLEQAMISMHAHDYSAAGALCESIWQTYKYAADDILARALSQLVICCENGYPRPAAFKTIAAMEQEAIRRGSPYLAERPMTIRNHPQASAASDTGTYILNCENDVGAWVTGTAPANWQRQVSDTPEQALTPGMRTRILLIHDDYDVNLHDALNVLDAIRESMEHSASDISDWEDLELYIRCQEDTVTPLLDTALSYYTERTALREYKGLGIVRIYLIDAAKRSAQLLFAQHPHIYPLTLNRSNGQTDSSMTSDDVQSASDRTPGRAQAGSGKAAGGAPTDNEQARRHMHIVLAAENPCIDYAQWIIKEAFWTLPRMRDQVRTTIHVISPDADAICRAVILGAPGLAAFSALDGKQQSQEAPDINDIAFPAIEYVTTSLTGQALQARMTHKWSPEDDYYYVVDAASDMDGVALATRIREYAIRQSVLAGHSRHHSRYQVTIAVRCEDPDIAELARELIVPKEEEHGRLWFNDYDIIPFGTRDSIYSWDQLSGGILEDAAECIHLVYSGAGKDSDNCSVGLRSYFARLYNHDASFSAAVSLPYRLYEAGVLPDAWFMRNDDAWWNAQVREELAGQYREMMTNRENDPAWLEAMDRYEHMRWCCYMLTRGWLPVSPVQVVQFMRAGVTRHSLQIARLNPCLCSWQGLEDLARELVFAALPSDYNSYNSKDELLPVLDKRFRRYYVDKDDYSYFQRINEDLIRQTPEILSVAWNIH